MAIKVIDNSPKWEFKVFSSPHSNLKEDCASLLNRGWDIINVQALEVTGIEKYLIYVKRIVND